MIRGRLPRVSALAAALGALSLSGCGGGIKSSHQIKITSQPAGATVLASGVEVGKTPMRVRPGDYFSSGFAHDEQGIVYRYKGTLSLKRPGCETYTTPVNDAVLSKDIHVELNCRPGAAAAVPEPPARSESKPAQPATAPPARPQSMEQRLRRAKDLYEKGLITEEEYQRVKARILKDL